MTSKNADSPTATEIETALQTQTPKYSGKHPTGGGRGGGRKTATIDDGGVDGGDDGTVPAGSYGTDGEVTITSIMDASVLDGGSHRAPMTAKGGRPAVGAATAANHAMSIVVAVTALDEVTSTTVETTVVNNATITSTRTTVSVVTVVSSSTAVYMPPVVIILTDSLDQPTATVTSTPSPLSTISKITLSDAVGRPTATLTTTVPAAPLTTVLRNGAGAPTATLTVYPVQPGRNTPKDEPPDDSSVTVVSVFAISKAEYFTGFFLPPLLSALLTIPIRILDASARQLQPFRALSRPGGADAASSLCLQTTGFYGVAAGFRALAKGDPLVFLTSLLLLCSALLVPLSSEAVTLRLHGSCAYNNFTGCAMTLGVFPRPAKATMGLLGAMAALVLAVTVVMVRWRSGVASNPWSIAGVAALTADETLRELVDRVPGQENGRVKMRGFLGVFGPRKFALDYTNGHEGGRRYGIMVAGKPESGKDALRRRPLKHRTLTWGFRAVDSRAAENTTKDGRPLPSLILSNAGRLAFAVFLLGVLVIILYYRATTESSGFEYFMDNQQFGVRFLFTAVGICITLFWSSFFTSKHCSGPGRRDSHGDQR
jgi:hypothetical protein